MPKLPPALHVSVTVLWVSLAVLQCYQQDWPNLGDRFSTAITTSPTRTGSWTAGAVGAVVASGVVLLVGGCASGFFVYKRRFSLGLLVGAGIIDFLEECLFRALLLPGAAGAAGSDGGGSDDGAAGATALDLGLALFIFVIYHLDVFHYQEAAPHFAGVFKDWRFMLIIAPCLGVGTAALFVGSGGSLWAPVIGHCCGLWLWLFLMGGMDRLEGIDPAGEEADNAAAQESKTLVSTGAV